MQNMNKLSFFVACGLIALLPACCGGGKCKDGACKIKKDKKETIVKSVKEERKSGPVQSGIDFNFDDLK